MGRTDRAGEFAQASLNARVADYLLGSIYQHNSQIRQISSITIAPCLLDSFRSVVWHLQRSRLHFMCQGASHSFKISLYFSGSIQGSLYMKQHVFSTDMLLKIGTRNKAGWLIPSSAK